MIQNKIKEAAKEYTKNTPLLIQFPEKIAFENGAKYVLDTLFPNGFDNWYETFYEIVSETVFVLDHPLICPEILLKIENSQGRGGLYDLSKQWTDEFELLHKGKDWDGDFFDAIDEFLNKKYES